MEPENNLSPLNVTSQWWRGVLKNSETTTIKGLALLMGFVILLTYLINISFFPSIDLFSFTSILAAAFLIGFSIVALVFLGLIYPTRFWILFLKDRQAEQTFTPLPSNTNIIKTTAIWFIAPLALATASQASVYLIAINQSFRFDFLTIYASSFASALFIATLFSIVAYFTKTISKKLIFKYFLYTAAAFLMTNVCCLILAGTIPTVAVSGKLTFNLRLLLGTVGILAFVTIYTLCLHLKQSERNLIALLLLFTLLIATSLYKTAPADIVELLHTGNYRVQSIILKSDFCKSLETSDLHIKNCTLNYPLVLWGMGDTYKISYTQSCDNTSIVSCDHAAKPHDISLIIPKDAILLTTEK
jgi:hypothetical protein